MTPCVECPYVAGPRAIGRLRQEFGEVPLQALFHCLTDINFPCHMTQQEWNPSAQGPVRECGGRQLLLAQVLFRWRKP